MKAARIEDGSLHIRDVEVPTPGADEALVRITAAGVCHSDLHLVRGDWNGIRPPVVGHEAIGCGIAPIWPVMWFAWGISRIVTCGEFSLHRPSSGRVSILSKNRHVLHVGFVFSSSTVTSSPRADHPR